ncbi:hypothetical protein Achl_4473 (plasmid) [Pseudarthrobacter chlorophenolicus A6]|uniref:Uncharacterized protein n=1 Tax=Pseudarthrobacter chlorophenolicus (strain ATCC 700700 / DSM 12829 / CIP 107037 / JCM 12360 / KCTC 9906 / NCIMB 13794 / A6) TaxID=452863 RepID=B8HJ27_PSECP|nr:hypothetical protein [Pseudarthrobacter chlorophenolicus]ACL42424.1 hypothetical protein Achl_4473 [Pseudarthrobacter chlorophenolicus A6]SDQ17939.1 hypothetical protein SAMN04489738_0530 [Pseudarthrobacter chlorophenolicus]
MLRPLHRESLLIALRSETGVINATAALVGLGIMTAVGGVAATSMSSLVPLAHDSAARQNATQIATAQGLARIMDGRFTDLDGLETGGYLPAYRAATGPRRFDTMTGPGGTCFVVVSRSATGAHFFVTDLIPAPEPLFSDVTTGCIDAGTVQAMAERLDVAAAGY